MQALRAILGGGGGSGRAGPGPTVPWRRESGDSDSGGFFKFGANLKLDHSLAPVPRPCPGARKARSCRHRGHGSQTPPAGPCSTLSLQDLYLRNWHCGSACAQRNRSSSPKEWENEASFRNRRPAGRPGLRPLSFRPPVAPRNVADSSKNQVFLTRQAAALKAPRAVFAQPLTLHLPLVDLTVLDPRPGVAPMPRCAGPTQHCSAKSVAPCALSSTALRLRLDVHLPLPLPAEECRPRDVTCFSLLLTTGVIQKAL